MRKKKQSSGAPTGSPGIAENGQVADLVFLGLGWGGAVAFAVLHLLLLTPFHRFLLLLESE